MDPKLILSPQIATLILRCPASPRSIYQMKKDLGVPQMVNLGLAGHFLVEDSGPPAVSP